jgi:hypothetical protein
VTENLKILQIFLKLNRAQGTALSAQFDEAGDGAACCLL